MPIELWWDAEDAAHIRSRSSRYPGVTAWKTRGADLRHYLERRENGDD